MKYQKLHESMLASSNNKEKNKLINELNCIMKQIIELQQKIFGNA